VELVELGTYNSLTEANLVKARLQSDGIEALVQSDDLGSTTPTLITVRGVRVLVREPDRARAMEALERMLPEAD
jgi:Putative prokaryotic signal transducing protein